MATRAGPTSLWRETMRTGMARSGTLLAAAALFVATLALAAALFSYHGTDPSLDTAAGGPVRNLLGTPGAGTADLLLALFGWPVVGLLPVGLIIANRWWRNIAVGRWRRMLTGAFAGVLLADWGFGAIGGGAVAGLPGGYGGLVGMGLASGTRTLLAQANNAALTQWGGIALGIVAGLGGIVLWARSLVTDSPAPRLRLPAPRRAAPGVDEQDGAATDTAAEIEAPRRLAVPRPVATPDERPAPVIADRAAAPAGARAKPRQASLDLRDSYPMPALDLLKEAPPAAGPPVDKLALDRNAQLLMSVLNDFKVDGKITAVRPGPVVTMYELEPAPGIKASRVIALADDIARNMSAVSARVATISGRNVIGIELPNARREMVNLHELLSSETFEDQNAVLPLVLGKNIAGDAVVADLAPMPHLLVAGTTGSGKSVGLNCMILSLLYRLGPDRCKMIMIDPKMLELSIYDGIPHLLAPVVTDPPKAVRALKWAVEQMEERYRMMASVNVRSLASFNDKVVAARAKGQPLGRKVQTGYDSDTGQPIYEEEQLDFQPLPKIVVVVDELADLMMTAGKEVEFLIQRLAQKARAAGIHLIMATQRPSVDVITGVIKANLPTRISFHVTSKIDSRTILGEQGAEQLLGKGDMLFMAGGKAISRVHGPFVSDEEVQAVADHWRAQGAPDYISSVTEEPEEGFVFDGQPTGDDSPEDQQYRQAIQIVCESQKASTSWLQRQLRIGYNSAARIVERMEKDGIVSRPDHVGRREVLRDAEGQPV